MKYYVEIVKKADEDRNYILQSDFFNTEKEAVRWWVETVFLDDDYKAHLMSATWNYQEDIYVDIEFVRVFK